MAINEIVVTGRIFRRLIDKSAKLWQRISWWTKASDVEFDDGKTAEQKVGNINGITSSFQVNSPDISASSFLTSKIKSDLNDGIINDRIQLIIDEDGNLGWKKDGADTVIPFSNVIGLFGKLKKFSMSSKPGKDCIYNLNGNCLPILVYGANHCNNGVTYYDEWDVFKKSVYSVKVITVTPKEENGIITEWKIVSKCLDKDESPATADFTCYYIDNQNNLKYDDFYTNIDIPDQTPL